MLLLLFGKGTSDAKLGQAHVQEPMKRNCAMPLLNWGCCRAWACTRGCSTRQCGAEHRQKTTERERERHTHRHRHTHTRRQTQTLTTANLRAAGAAVADMARRLASVGGTPSALHESETPQVTSQASSEQKYAYACSVVRYDHRQKKSTRKRAVTGSQREAEAAHLIGTTTNLATPTCPRLNFLDGV